MSVTAKVQAAKKKAQLARLAAKKSGSKIDKDGNSKYAGSSGVDDDGKVITLDAGFYADQPKQKVRAEQNKKIADANAEFKTALEDLEVAEITGEGLEAAQELVGVAGMVVQNLELSKSVARSGSSVLTNAGSK